jgi:hypothetical protein
MLATGKVVDLDVDVLSKVTQEDIIYFYLGVQHLPMRIPSPLRKDSNPSMGLFYSRDGKICYHDFATHETGTYITLLAKIYGIPWEEMVNNIYENLVLNGNPLSTTIQVGSSHSFSRKPKNLTRDLKVRIREWKAWDKEYWLSYGIGKRTLKLCNVYPISHIFFLKEDGTESVMEADKYAYAYVEYKDGNPSIKVYQPFNTKFKWISKHKSDVWDLWQQLPDSGDILIITSSRKDAMCIWENTGIPACGLQAESYLPKEHVVEELKNRFKRIYVLYDNDFTQEVNRGHEYGKLFAETFGLTQIELPIRLGSKDSSDLCKSRGREVLRETIFKLIYDEEDKECPF